MVSRALRVMVAGMLTSTLSGCGALILAHHDSVPRRPCQRQRQARVAPRNRRGDAGEAGDVSSATRRLARRHVCLHAAQSGMVKTEAHICAHELDDGRIRRTYLGPLGRVRGAEVSTHGHAHVRPRRADCSRTIHRLPTGRPTTASSRRRSLRFASDAYTNMVRSTPA